LTQRKVLATETMRFSSPAAPELLEMAVPTANMTASVRLTRAA